MEYKRMQDFFVANRDNGCLTGTENLALQAFFYDGQTRLRVAEPPKAAIIIGIGNQLHKRSQSQRTATLAQAHAAARESLNRGLRKLEKAMALQPAAEPPTEGKVVTTVQPSFAL